jgi:hypothetical protein
MAEPGLVSAFAHQGSGFVQASTSGLTGAHIVHVRRTVTSGAVAELGVQIGELTEVAGGGSSFALSADHNRLTLCASRAATPASFGALTVRGLYIVDISGLSASVVTQIKNLLNTYANAQLGATIATAPSQTLTSITASPNPITIQVNGAGQTVTVTALDQVGTPIPSLQLDVVSSQTLDATVSSATVTTGAAGTATFTVSPVSDGTPTVTVSKASPAVSLVIPVTVLAAAPPGGTVATVAITPSSASVEAGLTTAFTLTALNSSGGALDDKTYTASSSNTGVATVTSSGYLGRTIIVTAVAQGTCSVQGICEGVQSSPVTVTVTPVGGLGAFYTGTNIERPRVVPSFTYPTASRTVNVSTQAEFNTAVTNRLAGDRIVIAEGVDLSTWTQVTIPDNAAFTSTQWVQVTVTGHATEFGTYSESGVGASYRIAGPTKSAAGKTAKIRPAIGTSAFVFANGARGWWFGPGLEVTKRTGTTQHQQAVAFTVGGTQETVPANHPERIVIDRCYIHADGGQVRGAIRLGGRNVAVVGNDVRGLKETGAETHGILGGHGPGPALIHNNRFEATGIGIMFGGDSEPKSAAMMCSDYTITNNFATKDPAWVVGSGLSMKNHFEMKVGQRFRWEGNVGSRGPADGQTGMAVNLKSVNQNGVATWNVCRDVAFIRNKIFDTGWMWSFASNPQGTVAEKLNRVLIEENLCHSIDYGSFQGSGYTYQMDASCNYHVIRHNTLVYHSTTPLTGSNNNTALCIPQGNLGVGFVHEDNVLQHRDFGFFTNDGSGRGGTNALNALFVATGSAGGWVWRKNVYIRGPSASYPNTGANLNYFPTTESSVFVNYSGGNFRLTSSALSAFPPSSGSVNGCDIDALEAAVLGVETS